MSPFLSVIVPVYNTEEYLCQSIESLLSQEHADFEVILVDDGSTDSSGEICDRYCERDNRVRVVHKSNGGLLNARRTGVALASGEYVGFVDSDDWIEPSMYLAMCRAAVAYAADVVICDMYVNFLAREERFPQPIGYGLYSKSDLVAKVYPRMLYQSPFYTFGILPSLCTKIIRRSILLRNLRDVDEVIVMGEDAACTYGCLLDAESLFVLAGSYLYHYRQTSGSIVYGYDPLLLPRLIALVRHLRNVGVRDFANDFDRQLDYYTVYLVTLAMANVFRNPEATHSIRFAGIDRIVRQPMVQEAVANVAFKSFRFWERVIVTMVSARMSWCIWAMLTIRMALHPSAQIARARRWWSSIRGAGKAVSQVAMELIR